MMKEAKKKPPVLKTSRPKTLTAEGATYEASPFYLQSTLHVCLHFLRHKYVFKLKIHLYFNNGLGYDAWCC